MKIEFEEVLSSGTSAVNESLKYTCATAEYTGLVSLSYLKRAGKVVYDPLSKVVSPVCDVTSAAYNGTVDGIYNVYEKTSSGIGSLYGKTASGLGNVYDSTAAGIGKLTKLNPFRSSRINAIETRMEKIETWIEEIKDKGFIIAGPTAEAPAKKLSEGQEALLKNILLDNLDLMR